MKFKKAELDNLEKASEVLPERLELIGVEIDKEDILPSTVAPSTNTETIFLNLFILFPPLKIFLFNYNIYSYSLNTLSAISE